MNPHIQTKWSRRLTSVHSMSQATALAIVIPILYFPFMWLAFDFKLSPYSGMLLFSPAFAICSLVRVPLLGLVVGIGFLTLSHIAVSFSLARSKIWLISTCLVLAAISTESSREIYQKTKTVVGDGCDAQWSRGQSLRTLFLEARVAANSSEAQMRFDLRRVSLECWLNRVVHRTNNNLNAS